MMTYVYSAKNNAFFPVKYLAEYEKNQWDLNDKVGVSDEIASEFMAAPPAGKIRISNDKGLPTWGDVPPLTPEQQVMQAESMRQQYRALADEEINWRQDAIDAGIATEKEIAALTQWKKYRVLLMRVNTSMAPDIEWPVASIE
ncbi:tail fiber assembly protein [Enterobacter sp.]|uniref:tail fiber assembly protein n=1 Tax=Enterobacter sp. TaxID=42895 RepID=UPI00296FC1CB|nr:tail fiber assembly protein [Enterobacter sp.]